VNTPCPVALKEWAAICAALEAGRQTILLRKGGLVEKGETFALEHQRFWLYPTYLHQQEQGVAESDQRFLEAARAAQPPSGRVRLSLLALVSAAWTLKEEATALGLADLHAWTPATIASRFQYRTLGLTLLLLRVHRAETAYLIEETAEQVGCRSWVPLAQPLDCGNAVPILSAAEFAGEQRRLADRLSALGAATEVLLPSADPNSA
jgi:hypothetical protein